MVVKMRIVSYLLIIAMLMSCFSYASAEVGQNQNIHTFEDVKGHWCRDIIEKFTGKNWVKGYNDGKFYPNKNITRAEFTTMVVNIFKKQNKVGNSSFTDVSKKDWYYNAVSYAVAEKIVTGYEDGSFKPMNNMSRQDAAVLVTRLFDIGFFEESPEFKFADEDIFSEYSSKSIKNLASHGIVKGYPDKTFRPFNLITRAEAVKMLDVVLLYVEPEEKIPQALPVSASPTITSTATPKATPTVMPTVTQIATLTQFAEPIANNSNIQGGSSIINEPTQTPSTQITQTQTPSTQITPTQILPMQTPPAQTPTLTPTASPTQKTGKIVVNCDEWAISDTGYVRGDGSKFAENIINYFSKEDNERYLAYTSDKAYGDSFINQVKAMGHSIEKRTDITLTLDVLKTYDVVFLAAPEIPDNDMLIQYVLEGGDVYLSGATGYTHEYKGWNTFLNRFGLNYQEYYNGVHDVLDISGTHVLLDGLEKLYFYDGQTIEKLINPSDNAANIIFSYNGMGFLAVYDENYNSNITPPTNYAPRFISTPTKEVILYRAQSDKKEMDLSNWKVFQFFKTYEDYDPEWKVDKVDSTKVKQILNADASVLLSDIQVENYIINGKWKVDSSSDDDFIGFIFGYKDEGHFYLFDWKQGDQLWDNYYGEQGMSVKVINTNIPVRYGDLWHTAGSNKVKTIYHNNISYEDFEEYDFTLKFSGNGHFNIIIRKDGTILDNISLYDTTYTSGKFGFYNLSQEGVLYNCFTSQDSLEGIYSYHAKAHDEDADILQYSIEKGPNGMTIDKDTGEIKWTVTSANIGEHDVTIKVENTKGAYDIQEIKIRVVPPTLQVTATLPETVEYGDKAVLAVSVTEDVYKLDVTLDNIPIALDENNKYEFNATVLGDHIFDIRAYEYTGITQSISKKITVVGKKYDYKADFDEGAMKDLTYDEVNRQLTLKEKDDYAEDNYVYTSMVYTIRDIIIFGYYDNTELMILDSKGNIVWQGVVNYGEYKRLENYSGSFEVRGTKPFALLTGDPFSYQNIGFYAMDQHGKGLSTEFFTCVASNGSDNQFVLFAYEDDTEVTFKNSDTKQIIWSGTLQKGKSKSISGLGRIYIQVNATKPVSALTCYDEAYYVPSSDGNWIGTEFYTFCGAHNWAYDMTIMSYSDDASVEIIDSDTGELIWSGTVKKGTGHVILSSEVHNKYVSVTSDKPVAVCLQTWETDKTGHYEATYVVDSKGTGIGTEFISSSQDGGYLLVIGYNDNTKINLYNAQTGEFVKEYTVNKREYINVNPGSGLWKITTDNEVAIYSGYGGIANGGFAPVRVGIPQVGTWSSVFDSGKTGASWVNVSWKEKVYNDGSIEIYVSSSDDNATFTEPVKVTNGKSFSIDNGRYTKIEAILKRSSDGLSPVLKELTLSSKDYAPRFVSTPTEEVVLNIAQRDKKEIVLSNSEVIQFFDTNDDPDPVWDVDSTKVKQTRNADASVLLLSDIQVENFIINGRWKVDSSSDDDFIGFVFGYKDEGHFYLFDWKKGTQLWNNYYGEQGMSVKVINTDIHLDFGDLWHTAGNDRVKTIYHNNISYEDFEEYDFTLKFSNNGHFNIIISKDGTILDNISLYDTTYTSGKFGFYNFSQEGIVYSGFTSQELLEGIYSYHAKANNEDADILQYSIVKGPNGMTIDKDTGEIKWTVTSADLGEHDVTIKAEDAKGFYDIQEFKISVIQTIN